IHVVIDRPSNGYLSFNNNDGSFTYTPATNFSGDDSFTFQAFDGAHYSNVATVAIAVTSINDPPVGFDNTVTVNEDHPYAFSVADFGFDDSADNPSNNLLAVEIVSTPAAGSLTLDGSAVSDGQDIDPA